MNKKIINVTKPFLPPIEEFLPLLEDIWQSKILTNNGLYNSKFCRALELIWDVEHVVTFSNGTQALLAAISCLKEQSKGEIITTPYTFIASTNTIVWAGHSPVFVDICPSTLNIDPVAVEKAITVNTKAILAVHCYGRPCNVEALEDISRRYNIPVIYDAAHAFGVKVNEKSLMHFGEMSVMSFHATKVFNTFEGGAVACHSVATKDKLLNFANFGFQNETTITSFGLNAKMSEFNAALGLLQLKYVKEMLAGRESIAAYYLSELSSTPYVFIPDDLPNVKPNFAYFPIFISQQANADRDTVYHFLREHGFMVRRYFYPLTCDFGIPEVDIRAKKFEIANAQRRAKEILCLPIYSDLEMESVEELVALLKSKLK